MMVLTGYLRTIFFIVTVMLYGFAARSQTLVIHFYFDKSDLKTSAKSSIDSFLATKKNLPADTRIEISGHCDAIGSTRYNDHLSLRRIATVKKYLDDNYLDSGRKMTTSAHGERRPLNGNRTEKERMENRRVEIKFIQTEPDTMLVQEKRSVKDFLADTVTKSGTKLILRNINFVGGTHRFLPEATQPLQELLDAMKAFPHLIIEVHGHICCTHNTNDGYDYDTGTFDLSFQRANAVKKYLVDNGIDPARVSCRGIGHFNPIYPYPEKNDYEMQANRRVEIQVIRK